MSTKAMQDLSSCVLWGRWGPSFPSAKVLLTVVLTFAIGCSKSGPFEYVPVHGEVRYEDGTLLPNGFLLQFIPQDVAPIGNANPRPATARVGKNGQFSEVTSYKYGDGLVPGRHKVFVVTDESSLVPKEYTSAVTTPLIVDTADVPLKIQLPKPGVIP